MTRQQKYPETGTFHYHNQNPKNRLTGDCIIRAISRAMELERLRGIKKKANERLTASEDALDDFLEHDWK